MIPQEFVYVARAYNLLSEMDPRHLRKLVPLAEEKQFGAGQLVFAEGDRSNNLYLIVSGEVALEIPVAGDAVLIQKLQAGEAMGWSALTAEGRTHFQARAVTPVSAVAFPADRLRAAFDCDPEMGYALMKRLLELVTERLDATRMQVLNLHRQPEAARQA